MEVIMYEETNQSLEQAHLKNRLLKVNMKKEAGKRNFSR